MIATLILVIAIVVATIAQLVAPGRPEYHGGWYNSVLVGLMILLIAQGRSVVASIAGTRAKLASIVAIGGIVVVGFAAVVSGLLAPDRQVVTGAPGQQVRIDDIGGTLAFPLAAKDGTLDGDVMLVRPGRSAIAVGNGRNIGSFILRPRPRRVIYVQAADPHGAHLTVTQPSGAAFLSPVLLMMKTQHIEKTNLELPYDSFALPAAHRIVKAMLFNADQAAQLRNFFGPPSAAVIFAIDDEADQPLPNSIALARDGEMVTVAGIRLKPIVLGYPAVDVIAAPSLLAVVLGLLAAVLGSIFAAVLTRRGFTG